MTGLPMTLAVSGASLQDRDSSAFVLGTIAGMFPRLKKMFADAGYQGPRFKEGVAGVRKRLEVEIIKRSDKAKGFAVLPKRWVVERTIAWLCRCRRLAKDFECLSRNALAFLWLAAIRLMLRKLCNPS
jgi:transposase